MVNIALVTCLHLDEADEDAHILRQALESRGFRAEWVAWDDPGVLWSEFAAAILRSTWNYYHHFASFKDWIRRISRTTYVLNPVSVVEWNSHKGYLGSLENLGIAIVPTEFVWHGQHRDVAKIFLERNWSQLVIKPAISAASYQTYRFGPNEAPKAQEVLDDLSADRDVMIQEYMASVEDYGERSLIWIDGQVTHAIRKNARFSTDSESVSEAIVPKDDELKFAQRAIACVQGELLYARIDLMRDATGGIRLSELELIEPSLFLTKHPPALNRFADAICRRVDEVQSRE